MFTFIESSHFVGGGRRLIAMGDEEIARGARIQRPWGDNANPVD
jgi:hypothetical protein